jgi:hypothetical protein
MPTSLLALFVTLRSILRSRADLQVENLALRHQIGVLQRSVKKCPKLTSMDRLFTKYMVRGRKPPSQTWRTFLENHISN